MSGPLSNSTRGMSPPEISSNRIVGSSSTGNDRPDRARLVLSLIRPELSLAAIAVAVAALGCGW